MNTKKRVAVLGTVGLPANYGGFETLTDHLVTQLNQRYDMTVYCTTKKYTKEERVDSYKGAKLKYINLNASGMMSVLYDAVSILHSLRKNDILLILGVAGAWILPFIRIFTKKRIIISIDGIEWKRAKWGLIARLYYRWSEKIAVKYSHIDISDNESIQNYTAMRYGTVSRIVEYGSDHTLTVDPTPADIEKYPFLDTEYTFNVCRIEPENNIHIILKAYDRLVGKKLVIVGNWDKSDYGRKLKSEYSDIENITLYDPIYDQRTIDLLRGNASLYIHGHTAGGTNPSLVEAMYLGLPIISHGVSYNRVTTENKAIYFKSEADLLSAILSTNENRLAAIGAEMKAIAKRRYRWELIANKYADLFEEVFTISAKQRITYKTSEIGADILDELELAHLKSPKLIFE